MEKWKTAIREAQTFSRMHVLLGMLDACIKWDMSAENARCKVCRKKGMQPHACVTVGRCHLSMPCLGNVPLLLSLCLWLYFEFWPSGFTHSEALISQKRLTLTSINHSDETGTESCKTLQCCYPLDIQGTWTQMSTNPSVGAFVPLSISQFHLWAGMVCGYLSLVSWSHLLQKEQARRGWEG